MDNPNLWGMFQWTHIQAILLLPCLIPRGYIYIYIYLGKYMVNYNNSLTWILRPFGDDFPISQPWFPGFGRTTFFGRSADPFFCAPQFIRVEVLQEPPVLHWPMKLCRNRNRRFPKEWWLSQKFPKSSQFLNIHIYIYIYIYLSIIYIYIGKCNIE